MKALVLAFALMASPATAGSCLPGITETTTALAKLGEAPIGLGVSKRGTAIAIYAGPRGTWSVVQVTPGGTACIIDYGESWTLINTPHGEADVIDAIIALGVFFTAVLAAVVYGGVSANREHAEKEEQDYARTREKTAAPRASDDGDAGSARERLRARAQGKRRAGWRL